MNNMRSFPVLTTFDSKTRKFLIFPRRVKYLGTWAGIVEHRCEQALAENEEIDFFLEATTLNIGEKLFLIAIACCLLQNCKIPTGNFLIEMIFHFKRNVF